MSTWKVYLIKDETKTGPRNETLIKRGMAEQDARDLFDLILNAQGQINGESLGISEDL